MPVGVAQELVSEIVLLAEENAKVAQSPLEKLGAAEDVVVLEFDLVDRRALAYQLVVDVAEVLHLELGNHHQLRELALVASAEFVVDLRRFLALPNEVLVQVEEFYGESALVELLYLGIELVEHRFHKNEFAHELVHHDLQDELEGGVLLVVEDQQPGEQI